ncbi:MAG TPA: glutamate--tRNA ligase [Chitinophagaceae bacterium]
MNKKVRVRFAPSPTGGLHLGGVRTVLYNYLFAKKNNGEFILRIEDTDQSRYVEGAEQYITDCLAWCGLQPDESPEKGGASGPYRQSERKEIYRQYAEQLVKDGFAYYAFDTPQDLEKMRDDLKTPDNPSPQYDHTTRMKMRNSLTISQEKTKELLEGKEPHVIRIMMPVNETVKFEDMIRGEVNFETSLADDKVLLKADGMPTYHLAVVVDDYLMKISHVFRGEEWLPSAPLHILLWRYLGWEDEMPQWAHLPLILGPEGKLSKRDGAKYGFPVFAMNWTDSKTNDLTEGFREKGFLPEAFLNLLAMLGWNDGTEKEIFSLEELVDQFSIERVHKGGAHFDYEKAKWFNREWIKKTSAQHLLKDIKPLLKLKGIEAANDALLEKMIALVKDRCTLLTDFYEQTHFFFMAPVKYDTAAVKPKWNEDKKQFFESFAKHISSLQDWNPQLLETNFKELAQEKNIKPGELQLPMRIMLVGGKFGPPVFEIASLLGKQETTDRIKNALTAFAEG